MKLVIEDEAGTRSVVPFATDELAVGRAADGNAFRLPDRDVSRRHARFFRAGGAVFVEDLGSLTGTRVNGERITGKRRLREGDLVEIGAYDLAVVDGGEATAPGEPPPLPAHSPAPFRTAANATVDPNAVTRRLPRAGHAPADRVTRLRKALVVGLLAVALGLAAGWAAGLFGF